MPNPKRATGLTVLTDLVVEEEEVDDAVLSAVPKISDTPNPVDAAAREAIDA